MRVAVLGLVSNHGDVETPDYLKRRLDEASQYVPMDQLAICPRCGFGSEDEERQWGKLKVMTDVAREVWGDK